MMKGNDKNCICAKINGKHDKNCPKYVVGRVNFHGENPVIEREFCGGTRDCNCKQKPQQQAVEPCNKCYTWYHSAGASASSSACSCECHKPQESKTESWEWELCNQVGDIFNSHLLNENRVPREMFLYLISELLEKQKAEIIQKIKHD